jgi:subtilisin-like proprotein convertase family protein
MAGSHVLHRVKRLGLAIALVSPLLPLPAATAAPIGTDDFLISETGPNGSPFDYKAVDSSVAYNRRSNEYLVVWGVEDSVAPRSYVAAQRIDAATGAPIGTDDFRISDFFAPTDDVDPAVVWNSADNEYLVAWFNADSVQIHGQRLSATGAEVGVNDFQVSAQATGEHPSAAYNATDNEYLVVWASRLVPASFEREVFGQRLSAAGAELGGDVRISQMGPDGDHRFQGRSPDVAHNTLRNEYLVVWEGNETEGIEFGGAENEIYGRRLGADGGGVGAQFPISDMGTPGFDRYGAGDPAVAFSPDTGEYLVVWDGRDGIAARRDLLPPLAIPDNDPTGVLSSVTIPEAAVVGDINVYVEVTHTWVGDLSIRLESAGSATAVTMLDRPGVPASTFGCSQDNLLVEFDDEVTAAAEDACFADPPAAINGRFSPNEPLSAFDGGSAADTWGLRVIDDVPLFPGEFGTLNSFRLEINNDSEIFGQRLSGVGAAVGPNDFEIGGPAGPETISASQPDVVYNPQAQEYMVVWAKEIEADGSSAYDIAAKRLRPDGTTIEDDFFVSSMGPAGPGDWEAVAPAVAYNAFGNDYLVVWDGNDDVLGRAEEEYEIYGQRLAAGAIVPMAFDIGLQDPSAGKWYLRDSATAAVTSFFYGNPGDVPFMGDWDCDGVDTPGLYRQSDGFVYLRNSNTQGNADVQFFFGNPGDAPVVGDFNANGCDTVSIYRASEQRFYIVNALGVNNGGLGPADFSFLFGNPGDTPNWGDWDGDGVTEIGLYRQSTGFFYSRNSLTTGIADNDFFFGDPGDKFVGGDWGIVDGSDTPAVFRGSVATFFFKHTLTTGPGDSSLIFGEGGWNPLAGRFGL